MVKRYSLLPQKPEDDQSDHNYHEQRDSSRNHNMQKGLPVRFGQFLLPLCFKLISNIWIPGLHIKYDALHNAEAASQTL